MQQQISRLINIQNQMDGISYDESHVYIFKNNVVQVIENNSLVKTFYSNIDIKALCYDKYLNCFWAVTPYVINKVYKLNMQFQVVGRILYTDSIKNSPISLCHNCFTDVLNISFEKIVLTISKKGDYINIFEIENSNSLISCCYSKIFVFDDLNLTILSQNGVLKDNMRLDIDGGFNAVCLKTDTFKRVEFLMLYRDSIDVLGIDFAL